MPEPLVLGVDLGTSSLKCGVWDASGRRFGFARVAYPTSRRRTAAEQDAEDWWDALVQGVRRAAAGIDPRRLAAVGVGGHAPSPVFVDADLAPVAPVQTWLDRRSSTHRERLLAAWGREPATGPERLATEVSARALFLRQHRPRRFARAFSSLHSGDFLVARLTGRPITTSPWPQAILAAAGLPPSLVPEHDVAAGSVAGEISRTAANLLGVSPAVPVVAGGLDSFLGAVGSGICEPGDACLNGGSSSVVSLLARPPAIGRFELAGLPLLSQPVRTRGRARHVIHDQKRALEALESQAGPAHRLRAVGGRATDPRLNQLTAQILGRPLEIPRETDSGALGAAMLAAVASGLAADHREAARSMVRVQRVVDP